MLFLKGSGSESFKELTAKLVAETRATLTRNAEAQLRLFVTDTAFMLGSKGNVLEVAMYYFTHAAAGRLEHFENRSGLKPPPSISDFREDELPVSLGTHENYYRIRPSGKRVNLEVSFDVPSIRFPANVSAARKKQLDSEAAKLWPLFHQLDDVATEWVMWTLITLPDGTLLTYPGTGGFPDDYDPRQTAWYERAFKNENNWSQPFFDPATRRPVMAFSNRILSSRGRFLGMATFILSIESMLDRNSLRSEWMPEADFFLVHPDKERFRTTGQWALRILAGREFSEIRAKNWRTSLAPEWLDTAESEYQQALINTIISHQQGTFRIPYKGKDSLWVVGQLDKKDTDVALIGIVPFERILGPAKAGEEWVLQTVVKQYHVMQGLFVVVFFCRGKCSADFFQKCHQAFGKAYKSGAPACQGGFFRARGHQIQG